MRIILRRRIRSISGDHQADYRQWVLKVPRLTIGQAADQHVHIEHADVAPKHAVLYMDRGRLRVRALVVLHAQFHARMDHRAEGLRQHGGQARIGDARDAPLFHRQAVAHHTLLPITRNRINLNVSPEPKSAVAVVSAIAGDQTCRSKGYDANISHIETGSGLRDHAS